ncbi:MAG TPA: tRNA (adenine-N1)-methyltransferase [Methanomassiliicoccaceae archaeon]|nr:tRNA (adenine-N1)-methyltransferase [Methanomassiliicoccaceae archaeon]
MLGEGDLVYLLDDRRKRHWLTIRNDMVNVQGLGVVDAGRLIGTEDGSSIKIAGREFFVFKGGIIEQMSSLDRGPQIITAKDAATIVFHLDLGAGDAVLEAGVGSGALTLALLHAVAPSGKVITVELREEFAQKARKNIERSGLASIWDLRFGDVKEVDIGSTVDAVVLDMPDPWLALDNIGRFLRPGGRFAGYVPNANQVADLMNGLRDRGYQELVALENIQRTIEVHAGGVRPSFESLGHTGYMVFGRRGIRR